MFVAAEQERPLSRPPPSDARVSMATISALAMDAIIAATALTHDLTVWAQDDDFEVLAELAPDLRVSR